MNNTFSNKLNDLRVERHLTTGELAQRAGVGHSLISGLISNSRVIGEFASRKIGGALQLTGVELEDFVYTAINNCSEKVLETSKPYPAVLLNLIACKLKESGITPEKISRCARNEKDAALYFEDGSEALIKLELAFT